MGRSVTLSVLHFSRRLMERCPTGPISLCYWTTERAIHPASGSARKASHLRKHRDRGLGCIERAEITQPANNPQLSGIVLSCQPALKRNTGKGRENFNKSESHAFNQRDMKLEGSLTWLQSR